MSSFLSFFITTTPPTEEERREAVAQKMMALSAAVPMAILEKRQEAYHYFWSNADGLTPIEKAQALGARAGAIFKADYQLCLLLAQQFTEAGIASGLSPEEIGAFIAKEIRGVPAEYKTTAHDDGTVTIDQVSEASQEQPL